MNRPDDPRKRRLTYLALVPLLAVLAVVIGVRASDAATPANGYTNITFLNGDGTDSFYNYDFQSIPGTATNASMPVGLIFFNNAEVDKVKGLLGGRYVVGPPLASENYAYLRDAPTNALYDSDNGRKTGFGSCNGVVDHYRLYADGDDRMYDVDWGYFVVGTAHRDVNELCNASYGYSESAEGRLGGYWNELGYRRAHDWIFAYNYEPFRVDGAHVWDNDGYMTGFCVPSGRYMDGEADGLFGCDEWAMP